MNGLYGATLKDNAINTQEQLSKVILFLKYYSSDEDRLVKIKEEFAVIGLLGDIMTAGTGIAHHVTAQAIDAGSRSMYVPARSLLELALEILVFQGGGTETQRTLSIDASSEERTFHLTFFGSEFVDPDSLKPKAEKIVKDIAHAYGPEASVGLSAFQNNRIEIVVTFLQTEGI